VGEGEGDMEREKEREREMEKEKACVEELLDLSVVHVELHWQ